MEFKKISGNTAFIEMSYGIVPLYYLSKRDIVLVDSGTENSPKLLNYLKKNHICVRAVLCTHLHVDHIANNAALYRRYQCPIYGPATEIDGCRIRFHAHYPILPLTGQGHVCIEGVEIPYFSTPGHTDGHLAYVTPDGVCCMGDALLTDKMLRSSKIPYMENVDTALVSMEKIRQTSYPIYAMSHKGWVTQEQISSLIDRNIQKELDLYDILRKEIKDGLPLEQLITNFIRSAGVISQKMVDTSYVRFTTRVRIQSLANTGEYDIRDDCVYMR